MNRSTTIARYLLGALLVVFGLNGFLNFLPTPPLPEPAGEFMGALAGTGYLMLLVKAIEVVVGALLLSNRLVPLALVVLAPISVNIVLFHLFLAPGGSAMALIVFGLNAFLAWSYRVYYAPLTTLSARPQAAL